MYRKARSKKKRREEKREGEREGWGREDRKVKLRPLSRKKALEVTLNIISQTNWLVLVFSIRRPIFQARKKWHKGLL